MARSVNFVWNYVNELSSWAIKERGQFLSAFDLHPYTKGAGKELGLHSHTLQCVAKEYVTRRKQFKKSRLNWRKSGGAKRSLGWIPVNTGAASWKNGQVYHNGHYFKVWDSYGLSQYQFRTASFNEDARGRWYFNVVVEVEAKPTAGTSAAIFVGNVQPLPLTKTTMAKSVLDAGWGILKTTLEYKCNHAGVVFQEVNEAYTTQVCSCYGCISSNSPKGRAGLRIREWTCECGTTHDRDINAARNILAAGYRRLAGGIPLL